MAELEAGPELDAKVADIVGDEGEQFWIVTNDGGKTMAAWTNGAPGPWWDYDELSRWLHEEQGKGRMQGHEILERRRNSKFSTDPGEAIKALEKFCRDNNCVANTFTDGNKSKVDIVRSHDMKVIATATESLPLAICRAIVSAHEAVQEAKE